MLSVRFLGWGNVASSLARRLELSKILIELYLEVGEMGTRCMILDLWRPRSKLLIKRRKESFKTNTNKPLPPKIQKTNHFRA